MGAGGSFGKGLLWRQRKLFSLRLLFVSIVLSVLSVTSILSISDVLKSSLMGASSNFLAGDRQLTSPREVPEQWLLEAKSRGLDTARAVEFRSMLRTLPENGDEPRFQLVSVKAVDGIYPLKGELLVSRNGQEASLAQTPATNSIWLQKRLYPLLELENGSALMIGEHPLKANGVLEQEPDVGFQIAGLAPRVMMRLDELEATGVVQPGSRVKWIYFFSGPQDALESFDDWLQDKLVPSQKWLGIQEGRPAIADALEKADRYLLLGGSLAVLLSALAIAIASRQFAREQRDTVAVVKALGATSRAVSSVYVRELFVLAVIASVIGVMLGMMVTNAWVTLMQQQSDYIVAQGWLVPGPYALMVANMTALLMLAAFAWPQINALRKTPSMKVLRDEGRDDRSVGLFAVLVALAGLFVLLFAYGRDLTLVLILILGVGALVCSITFIHALTLRFVLAPAVGRFSLGSALRHTLQGVTRRPKQTLVQLSVFTLAIFLFAALLLTRTGLINDWQAQLPDDAPNHFLVNVVPETLDDLSARFEQESIQTTGLYPMVRGRLSHINGEDVRVAVSKEIGALNRELNLTWTDRLPSDNEIVAGHWWREKAGNGRPDGVSIEAELASKLDIGVGDSLTFNMAGTPLDVEVESVRTVQWDSMRPNFYMIFQEETLARFPATYITSFYLPSEQKTFLNSLSRDFPQISVLELDQLIVKIRSIVEQVSAMIELLLGFILMASLLVLAALVATTRTERVNESVLLRTMGATKGHIYKIQMFEFLVLGALSGLFAVLGAEFVVYFLKQKMFAGQFAPRVDIWFAVTILSALVLAALGFLQTRKVPKVSPMHILRAS